MDTDETLSADPDFAAVCDEHRDAWIAALEHDPTADGPGAEDAA